MQASFDDAVFEFFAGSSDVLHSNGLGQALRKRVGHVVVFYDDEHWKGKRGHVPKAPAAVDMARPFGAGFNFNKAAAREKIMSVELRGVPHPVLVNVSPLMIGHTVVPLWAENE